MTLCNLIHENVIKLNDFYYEPEDRTIFITQELMDGDLLNFLNKNKMSLN